MLLRKFILYIRNRFSLLNDVDSWIIIKDNGHDNASFKGAILWVLLIAIVICCVGLNTNSVAVVIGAMLISPLMGPIIGMGLGLATHDDELILKSLRNLAGAFIFSLIVSTTYFYLSPLKVATPEILARISPSIRDVVIAFCGGLAGMIALTRKEKSFTVIPGVAIATALMPPLCVTGYWLSQGELLFALKSFYLLFINCVFIAGATFLVAQLLDPPHKQYQSIQRRKIVNAGVRIMIIVTLVPSILMTINIIQQAVVDQQVRNFSQEIIDTKGVQVIEKTIDYDKHKLSLWIIGSYLEKDEIDTLLLHGRSFPTLQNYTITIKQGVGNSLDKTKEIIQPLVSDALHNQNTDNTQFITQAVEDYISKEYGLNTQKALQELKAFEPFIQSININISELNLITNTGSITTGAALVTDIKIITSGRVSTDTKARIEKWLETKSDNQIISITWE